MKRILSIFLTLSLLAMLLTAPVSAAVADTEPTMVTTHAAATTIAVTWRNPASTTKTLAAVEMYDGNGAKINQTFSTAAGARCKFKQADLTTNKVYKYTLKFKYTDGTERNIELADKTTSDTTRWWGDQYNITVKSGISGTNQFTYAVDRDMYTGSKSTSSIMTAANCEADSDEVVNPVFALTNVKKASGKKYKFSFDFYTDTPGKSSYVQLQGDTKVLWYGSWTSNAWEHYETTFTMTADDKAINFKRHMAGRCWYDNIALYELDADNNTVGGNLLAAYSSETLCTAKDYYDVKGLAAKSGNNSATITWQDEVVGSTHVNKKMNIYQVESGNEKLLASLMSTDETYTVNGLTNDKEYTFKVKAYNNNVESAGKTVKVTPKDPDTSVPEAVWADIVHGDKSLNISWQNPAYIAGSKKAVTKVALYKVDGEKETFISDAFDVTSRKKQYYAVSNLENDKEYTYKLKFEFTDYRPLEIILKDRPSAQKSDRLGNFANSPVIRDNPGNGKFNVTVDTQNHTGSSTASIKVNSIGTGASMYDTFTLTGFNVKKGKTYRFEFDYKAEGSKLSPALLGGWNTPLYYTEGTHAWQHVQQDVTWSEDNYIFFKSTSGGTGWYDNISLRELADGQPTGNNLLDAMSAENLISNIGITTPNITATAENDGAAVTWGDTQADYINFYVNENGNLYLRASVPASDKKAVIGSLINGTEYVLEARAEINGIEAPGKTVNVTPKASAYVAEPFKLYQGTTEIGDITASGTYKITINVTNNTMGADFGGQLIVAQYDGDVLVKVDKTDIAAIANGDSHNFEQEFTVSDINRRVKTFLWDNIKDMNPIKSSVEF